KAEIPGFLKDRNWVDFSNETKYDTSIYHLIWGITGEKPKFEKALAETEKHASVKPFHGSKGPSQIVDHIKNAFVRNMERRLRMSNTHWIQAGLSVPVDDTSFTSV